MSGSGYSYVIDGRGQGGSSRDTEYLFPWTWLPASSLFELPPCRKASCAHSQQLVSPDWMGPSYRNVTVGRGSQ